LAQPNFVIKKLQLKLQHKIKAVTPFKVIQGHRGRYQSKAHIGLLVSD